MPQFTHFPSLPKGAYQPSMDAFIRCFRTMPIDGESFKEFRNRLKKTGIWSREKLPQLLTFMRLAHRDPVVPSTLVKSIIEATDLSACRDILRQRLWNTNPLLFKVVVERIHERVHSPNEILKFVDSFAYPGNRVTGPEVRAWLAFAQGLELFTTVGIRLGLSEHAAPFLKEAELMDIDDFLEEDREEVPLDGPAGASERPPQVSEPAAQQAPPPAPPAASPPVAAREARPAPPRPASTPNPPQPAPAPADTPSAQGRGRSVPLHRYREDAIFGDDLLGDTYTRITGWWSECSDVFRTPSLPSAADFDLASESWMEDAPRALYNTAVAAALIFRLGRSQDAIVYAYRELSVSGALDALHDGTAPEGPLSMGDAQALMLASIVARRCAEHPDLALKLEKRGTSKAIFEQLESCLGQGLFNIELFWIVRALAEMGAIRAEGLSLFTGIPSRDVRQTLFRLGFIDTPYASTSGDLTTAAAAMRKAVGELTRPEDVIRGFGRVNGCGYGCVQRRTCDYTCRERIDLG